MLDSDTFVESPSQTSLIEHLKHAGTLVHFQRGDTLSRINDQAVLHVLASGCVVAVKRTTGGLPHNVALYLPGDIVGHEIVSLGSARCDCVALAATTSHRVAVSAVRDAIAGNADYAAAFWRHVAFHGALAQDWLLSIGRQSAYARTAHLLCEIIYRIGGARDERDALLCPMRLTQADLADTLGLSVVHVNRILMRLKEEGLIRSQRGHIEVLNWPLFKAAAGFETGYLKSGV